MFMGTARGGGSPDRAQFREGFELLGRKPALGPASPDSGAQMRQMNEPPVMSALS